MRRKNWTLGCVAVVVAASLTGGTAHADLPEMTGTLTYDEALAAVDVPEFAGFWLGDEPDTIVVALTRSRGPAAAEVRGQLARLLRRPDIEGLDVVVAPARFSFDDLKGWHDALAADVLALPGAVWTDVDERGNVVRIGTGDVAGTEAAVRDLAETRGVPRQAIAVEHATPLVPHLRDVNIPVVGGVEIGVLPSASICTLGFPAIRGGVQGFVTNSHCTAVRSSVDGTVHDQPFGGVPVGQETADPAYFTGGACPVGRFCRYSDSAFSTLPVAALYNQGRIARPPAGSITWNGTDTYRITAEGAPVLNETVTKVGRTSGRTSGAITRTCVNTGVSGVPNLTMLCQYFGPYTSQPGDSGSPVFRITSGTDVTLRGINWGSNATEAVMSSITDIQRGSELGSIQTCAPGFGC